MTLDIKQYDERPVRIQAVQVTEKNLEEVATWMEASRYSVTRYENSNRLVVEFDSHRLGRDRTVHLEDGTSGIYAVKHRGGNFTLMYEDELKKLWKKVK